jgi:septal ring factor EnvC (AmiA/AmiB activator)
MCRIRQIILLLVVSCLGSAFCGCNPPQRRAHPMVTENAPSPPSSGSSAKRFQDTPLEGRTAVESAIELSEKYARLSDQTIALREENQRLTTDNEALLQQIATLEAKLKQSQKELGEANDLLIEMLTELNTWKTNILGFRGEMRDAAKAQLEALLKVLEILGGEADAANLERRHAATLSAKPYGSQNASEPNTATTGEPNAP